MQTSSNDIAIMACHASGAKFLYPDGKPDEVRQIDGQYEKFTLVERNVRQKLQEVVGDILNDRQINSESLISGALTMALCYTARLEREKMAGEKLHCRILVVTGSNDSATQYMNYMNIFFTAQKMVGSLFLNRCRTIVGVLCFLTNIPLVECHIGRVQLGSRTDAFATSLRHHGWQLSQSSFTRWTLTISFGNFRSRNMTRIF